MKRAALLALLLFAGGCKKKAPTNVYRELREMVCMCKDLACVEKVTQQFHARGVEPRTAFPEELKKIEECMTKAAGNTLPRDASADMPSTPPRREADALINAARTWQKDPKLAIAAIEVRYVEASGLLDDAHGELTVTFGTANPPADDPSRKTGAPVVDTERPTECLSIASMPGRGWSPFAPETCVDVNRYIAKCAVVAIWEKAIKLGAPKDALAVITFRNTQPPMWGFSITDAPRDVHIAHEFPDDCERTLEKSP